MDTILYPINPNFGLLSRQYLSLRFPHSSVRFSHSPLTQFALSGNSLHLTLYTCRYHVCTSCVRITGVSRRIVLETWETLLRVLHTTSTILSTYFTGLSFFYFTVLSRKPQKILFSFLLFVVCAFHVQGRFISFGEEHSSIVV